MDQKTTGWEENYRSMGWQSTSIIGGRGNVVWFDWNKGYNDDDNVSNSLLSTNYVQEWFWVFTITKDRHHYLLYRGKEVPAQGSHMTFHSCLAVYGACLVSIADLSASKGCVASIVLSCSICVGGKENKEWDFGVRLRSLNFIK
jgi:hypothetical protein